MFLTLVCAFVAVALVPGRVAGFDEAVRLRAKTIHKVRCWLYRAIRGQFSRASVSSASIATASEGRQDGGW